MISKGQEDLTKKNLSRILEDLTWDLYKNKDLKDDIRNEAKNLIDVININFDHPFKTQVNEYHKGEVSTDFMPSNELVVCRISEENIKKLNNVFLVEPGGCTRYPISYNYNGTGRSPKYACYYDGNIVHVLCYHRSYWWDASQKYERELKSKNILYTRNTNGFIVEIGNTTIDNIDSFCKNIKLSKECYYYAFENFVKNHFGSN